MLLTTSCQKQELDVPQTQYQEFVYEVPKEVFTTAEKAEAVCTCQLNVKSNKNNISGPAVLGDWAIRASVNNQQLAAFGKTIAPGAVQYTSASSSPTPNNVAPLGSTESITFYTGGNSDLKLSFLIPSTANGNNSSFINTRLVGNIRCSGHSSLTGQHDAFPGTKSTFVIVNGAINNCRALHLQ